MNIGNLRVEYLTAPLSIHASAPRFSWTLSSTARGDVQRAYQIQCGSTAAANDLWDSGVVHSSAQNQIVYAGTTLVSKQAVYWRVRVQDSLGIVTAWSSSTFEMGLLHSSDWTGSFIQYQTGPVNTEPMPSPVFRKEFALSSSKTISKARLYLTAMGLFSSPLINGQTVGNELRSPGWTDYTKRLTYSAFDVTSVLTSGTNCIAVTLGDGWYVGCIADGTAVTRALASPRSLYGINVPALIAQIVVYYSDGTTQTVATDTTWSATAGPIRSNDLWSGENYDARLALGAYSIAGYNASGWSTPTTTSYANALVGQVSPPIRATGTISPASVSAIPASALNFTMQSATYDSTTAKFGSALSGGSALYASTACYAPVPLTVEFWIRAPSAATNTAVIILNDNIGVNTYSVNIGITTANVLYASFYSASSTQTITTTVNPFDGLWHHVACVFTSSGTTFYVDGVSAGSSTAVLHVPFNPASFTAGIFEIDEFAVWAMARYTGSFTPQTSAYTGNEGMRGLWHFDGNGTNSSAAVLYQFDFGQLFAGHSRLTITASAGTQIQLAHGEKATNGLVDQSNLDTGIFRYVETDSYICAGTGQEVWEPSFTVHSFRYVTVCGYAGGTPPLSLLTGVITHTDLTSAGSFTCSNATVNRIVQNAYWSYRSNIQSILNDCAGRERDGWTADAQVSVRALSYFFDCSSFLTKYMQDMVDGQAGNGCFPDTAPFNGYCGFRTGSPGWGDAGVIIPWRMYQVYGDTRILANNYAAMQAWMGFWASNSTGFIPNITGWGPEYYPVVGTDSICAGAAYYAYSALLMSRIAGVLNKPQDVQTYALLFSNIRDAIAAKYIPNAATQAFSGTNVATQGAYTLHVMAGSVVPTIQMAGLMAADIATHSGNLTTGLCATPNLLQVLDQLGRPDLAYQVATIPTGYSFASLANGGATTMWENWYGANSLNHHFPGGAIQWFFHTVAGIGDPDPVTQGFTSLTMRPFIATGLTSTSATFNSINGTFSSAWTVSAAGLITWTVTIPPGSSANLWCPSPGPNTVLESGIQASKAAGLVPQGFISSQYPLLLKNFVPNVNGFPSYERFIAKSGTYVFTVNAHSAQPRLRFNKATVLRRRK